MSIALVIDATALRALVGGIEANFGNAAGEMFLRSRVVPYLKEEVASTFTRGTGRSTSWPPLAQSTLEEKRRLGYPEDPLIRTGEMMSQVWQFQGSVWPIPGGVELIYPDPREAEGIRRYIGHQLGAPHGGRNPNLPARPMVELAEKDEAAILALATEYFTMRAGMI